MVVSTGLVAFGVIANCSSSPQPTAASPLARGPAAVAMSLSFGPKQLPSREFGRLPFDGAYVNAGSVQRLQADLPRARAEGMHLILKLVGSRERFQNADQSFSLAAWKREIDRLRGFDLSSYVEDRTVIGAELVNEPHDPNNWGGTIISKADLEAAAAYAKSIWPYLPVGAGRSDYVAANAPWEHLDFGHSQYHMRKGDAGAWLQRTVAESRTAGVALLLSLDFYAGQVGDTPMSAEELRRFGTLFAGDTYACALTGYIYNEAYFAQPGILDAFRAIQDVASSHPAPPCHVGPVKR
jgi:hypothetical protein